ncbi:uncharacterized protein LOC132746273 [Ruditapes philippinarum]|uniref:uncharacterized protein LOC132746273 n=1 Tax=Ruditapes philippinarum TaxID=129788 RepID=UPI00295A8ED3|nr:uncharacterized protein LOC132746273 [Ruditapes philippinarum]
MPVLVDDIVKIFDCALGLKGKPKLFFIQACRSRQENPVCSSKYDFGHWIYSKVDVTEDVDNLYGDIKEKALQHPKPVEDSMPGSSLQTKKDEESMSTVIMRQMEDGRGDLEEETFLETSFDIIPINCPDDFLFMYPVMPGKSAISDSMGSLLLQFMCKGENVEMLIKGNSLLQYLTYVSRDMAAAEYLPDLEMTSESEEDRIKRLRKYLSHSIKKLSEDKQLVIKELRASHAENIKTKDDPILVERYLNDNLENFTVTEMQGLLKHLMPLKMCACIIHRLRGDILLTPKSKKSPMAKLLDYFRKVLSPRQSRKAQT